MRLCARNVPGIKHFSCKAVLLLGFLICFLTASLIKPTSAHRQNPPAKASALEDAYRANNLGVALLEQFKHKEAADAFKRALRLEPGLTLARINLGIALFNVPDLAAAQRELQAASASAASAPQPPYVLGLAAKTQNKPEEAIAHFQKVLRLDPNDVGAHFNSGLSYLALKKFDAAPVLVTAKDSPCPPLFGGRMAAVPPTGGHVGAEGGNRDGVAARDRSHRCHSP